MLHMLYAVIVAVVALMCVSALAIAYYLANQFHGDLETIEQVSVWLIYCIPLILFSGLTGFIYTTALDRIAGYLNGKYTNFI